MDCAGRAHTAFRLGPGALFLARQGNAPNPRSRVPTGNRVLGKLTSIRTAGAFAVARRRTGAELFSTVQMVRDGDAVRLVGAIRRGMRTDADERDGASRPPARAHRAVRCRRWAWGRRLACGPQTVANEVILYGTAALKHAKALLPKETVEPEKARRWFPGRRPEVQSGPNAVIDRKVGGSFMFVFFGGDRPRRHSASIVSDSAFA